MRFLLLLFMGMCLLGITWLFLRKKQGGWQKITTWIENCKERNICLCLFFAMILIHGSLIFVRKLPFIADEVYSLSGAAFFAGYDWSNYMSLHKFYNFGYTMLLSPLYKIFNDPVTIYRGMLFGNALVFTALFFVVYYIARKHLQMKKMTSIAMALVCSHNSILLFFKGFVYNELPLAMITWLCVCLLLELSDSTGKKRVLLSILLGIVSAYAYLIHSRCVIIYGALAVLILLFLVAYKKWLVQPIAFGAAFGISILWESQLVQYVRANLYRAGSDVVMKNSVTGVVTNTGRFASLKASGGIFKVIKQFFSLSGTLTVETGGLLTLVTVIFLCYLWKNSKKIFKGEEKRSIFILLVFATVSFWGMIACIAVTGATNGYPRFLVYSRYFSPFIGPFLLLGLYLLKNYKEIRFKWMVLWSAVLFAIVAYIYVFFSFPILDGVNMKDNGSLYLFFPFARYGSQSTFSKNVFAIALSLLFLFTAILLFLYRKKQFIALSTVALLFSGALVWRVEQRQCTPAASRRYEASNATYELLKQHTDFADKDIYCIGSEVYRKAVLVACYDKDIQYSSDNLEPDNDTILISGKVEGIEKYQPPYIFQMDNNEWIGVWSVELKQILEQKYTPYIGAETES